MPYTDYAQNKIQDAVHRGQTLGAPATKYYALITCTKGARANSTAYSLNDTIAILANDTKYHLYKCTTAGTSAASQSTLYPGVAAEVITDGSAVFTEQSTALDAGTAQVEVSGGSYARVAVTASLANFNGTHGTTTGASSGTTGIISNATTVTFPTPSADWVTGTVKIWGWAMYDASTSGNCWEWGPLNTLQSVLNGQSAASFAVGVLTSQLGT